MVTGANGFIGSNLCRELLNQKYQVRALVRNTGDLRSLDGVPVEMMKINSLDVHTLSSAARNCDVMFHTAAVYSYYGHSEAQLNQIAVDGTRNALRAAKESKVSRVVLTSSSVVFGSEVKTIARNEGQTIGDEYAPPYFHSKVKQEKAAVDLARELGIDLLIVNPTVTVGPHDYRPTPSTGAILQYLLDPWRATFPGGCNIVHVGDVAKGHILVARSGIAGRRYILGSENVEWSLFHRIISELCGLPGPWILANRTSSLLASAFTEAAAKLSGTKPSGYTREQVKTIGRFYWYDNSRARQLGYAPMPSRRALAGALGWLVTSPHFTRKLRRQIKPSQEIIDHEKWKIDGSDPRNADS
jgi:dihydroflavonol-4-reductase